MGTFIWLHFQKKSIKRTVKHEIINSISKSDLAFIKLSKVEAEEELDWEHSKEFEFKNNMYDVVYTETTSDSVFYWCWLDKKETQLNILLAELVKNTFGNNQNKKKNEKALIDFCKSLYFYELSNLKLDIPNYCYFYSDNYFDNYYSIKPNPTSPPPRLS
ncbi:MAG: hypothetical protein H6586_07615 [Flavobacteriales bacterium]|nr:hypothetical protein [Flavobacteriales bacterium]